MTSVILKDLSEVYNNLLPITFTRPVSEIRIGIFTIREKWQHYIPGTYSYDVNPLLQPLFPPLPPHHDTLVISSHIIPSSLLAQEIAKLNPGQKLISASGEEIACRGINEDEQFEKIAYHGQISSISRLYDIFLLNGTEIENDIKLINVQDCISTDKLPDELLENNRIIGPRKNLFIHKKVIITGAVINLSDGPVYIGPDAKVMEGATLRGPIAICDHSEIRMGARIYENTTVGPFCKVGGEISNVVFIGHSNKAHDGFLGNSVIGEWCNLGAGTVSSNLKNDYSEIKLWNYPSRRFLKTGLQFCGLIMGDHSKTGINTMINTATVFGVGVNFHGAGYPRNFVPSFTEGSVAGMHEVSLNKFLEIAARVLARRNLTLTDKDIEFYNKLYSMTETYR